ncbi:MAG: class I SAM-dependent methyltransferase [Ignavibacteriales bacterium]|nr:MAG: class I SAM-dependent methyltransferase [Ignavibacteriales bacterium]
MIKDYTFTSPKNYLAYVERTNEKLLLQEELLRAFNNNELPIKKGDTGKKILDLGCGLGTHTNFLSKMFPDNKIIAIDISKDYIDLLIPKMKTIYNVELYKIAFEDYIGTTFDFILASHVLQYIQTPFIEFTNKIIQTLKSQGELWIVLQEKRGLNQIIVQSKEILNTQSSFFKNWFTHEEVRVALDHLNVTLRYKTLHSRFRAINYITPTADDINFLNFVLLNDLTDYSKHDLLKIIELQKPLIHNDMIYHDVGISKVRRMS